MNKKFEEVSGAISAFIAMMNAIVTPDPKTSRTRFPKFRITDVIRQKTRNVLRLLQEDELAVVEEALSEVQKHLQNQQASFARGLVSGLREEYQSRCEDGYDRELLGHIWKKIEDYETLVSRYFDVEDASVAYWRAIDVLDSTAEDQARRWAKHREKELAAAKAKAEAEAKRARVREATRAEAEHARRTAKVEELSDLLDRVMQKKRARNNIRTTRNTVVLFI